MGQSTYKGLTPGQSTRSDVERALGQPVHQISERLFEYAKDGKQIYVQYSKDSPTAIRFQVIYSPSVERESVLVAERLPKVADTSRPSKKGALEEYFAAPQYMVLTYEGSSPTRVAQVGYYSRALFESVTPELPKSSAPPAASQSTTPADAPSRPADIPSLNANVAALLFYEGGAENVPFGQRQYKTRFSKADTRGVCAQLDLSHPDAGRTSEFSIEYVFHHNGAFHYKTITPSRIEAGWTSSNRAQCIGWPTAGNWAFGSYLAELFIEGRKVAAGSFEVY